MNTDIVTITHGSHLYGTNTVHSDTDFKGVYFPDVTALLLGRAQPHHRTSTKLSEQKKNISSDVDTEKFSLQRYIKMVTEGQPLAMELLFAPDQFVALPDNLELASVWKSVVDNREKFFSKQCVLFVKYCKTQADRYGIKGSRVKSLDDMLVFFDDKLAKVTGARAPKLGDYQDELVIISKADANISLNMMPVNGIARQHLYVCNRNIPFTANLNWARDVLASIRKTYGDRSTLAAENEGIDWKAISHAVRVAGQALEFYSTGNITFPRTDANLLRQIKRGAMPYDEATGILEMMMDQIPIVAERSGLPDEPNYALAEEFVLHHYKTFVRNCLST